MSFFTKDDQIKSINFNRPLFYSGEKILEASMQKLKQLNDERLKYYDSNKSEPIELTQHIQFLGRLENVIQRHIIYNMSIQEAVNVGLIK